MDETDFEGTLVLEQLAAVDRVDEFFEAVDADDRATASAERLYQVRADEAGAARDQIGAARPQIVARRADQRDIPKTARQLRRERVEGVVVDGTHAVGPRRRRRRALAARPPPKP